MWTKSKAINMTMKSMICNKQVFILCFVLVEKNTEINTHATYYAI